jgi:hypothetical protein
MGFSASPIWMEHRTSSSAFGIQARTGNGSSGLQSATVVLSLVWNIVVEIATDGWLRCRLANGTGLGWDIIEIPQVNLFLRIKLTSSQS